MRLTMTRLHVPDSFTRERRDAEKSRLAIGYHVTMRLADESGIPRRCVTRCRADAAADIEIRAVERQLRLRAHLGGRHQGERGIIR